MICAISLGIIIDLLFVAIQAEIGAGQWLCSPILLCLLRKTLDGISDFWG
jgi:hypothetical protein